MSHFTLGVVNVGGGESRGGECRTIVYLYIGHHVQLHVTNLLFVDYHVSHFVHLHVSHHIHLNVSLHVSHQWWPTMSATMSPTTMSS